MPPLCLAAFCASRFARILHLKSAPLICFAFIYDKDGLADVAKLKRDEFLVAWERGCDPSGRWSDALALAALRRVRLQRQQAKQAREEAKQAEAARRRVEKRKAAAERRAKASRVAADQRTASQAPPPPPATRQ